MKENPWYCKVLATSTNFIDNFGYFYLFYASVALMVDYASISWLKLYVAFAVSTVISIAWAVAMQFTSNANCWISVIEQPQNLINHVPQLMLLMLTVTIFFGSLFLPDTEIDIRKNRFDFEIFKKSSIFLKFFQPFSEVVASDKHNSFSAAIDFHLLRDNLTLLCLGRCFQADFDFFPSTSSDLPDRRLHFPFESFEIVENMGEIFAIKRVWRQLGAFSGFQKFDDSHKHSVADRQLGRFRHKGEKFCLHGKLLHSRSTKGCQHVTRPNHAKESIEFDPTGFEELARCTQRKATEHNSRHHEGREKRRWKQPIDSASSESHTAAPSKSYSQPNPWWRSTFRLLLPKLEQSLHQRHSRQPANVWKKKFSRQVINHKYFSIKSNKFN